MNQKKSTEGFGSRVKVTIKPRQVRSRFGKSPSPSLAIDVLVLAAWVGILAGFLEFGKHLIGGWWIHRMIFFGPHSAWMAPAGSAILFAVAGTILGLLRLNFPRWFTLRCCTAILLFLAALNLALLSSRIHTFACVILAIGCAKVATDILLPKRDSFLARLAAPGRWILGMRLQRNLDDATQQLPDEEPTVDRRRVLVSTAVAIGAPAVGVNVWQRQKGWQLARTRPVADHGRPNVLLLVLDTVRARNLSLYGYQRNTTPNLSRIAAQGVCFDWAIAEAPWTLPSHASMFTGRHAHELGCTWYLPLGKRHPTLAETLRGQGYATSGFVANTIYCNSIFGIDRGFEHYEDVFVDGERICQASNLTRKLTETKAFRRLIGFDDLYARPDAPLITDRFLNWLDQRGNEPFFAFLNYFDAHAPYVPPAPFDTMFGPRRKGLPFNLATEYTERVPGWLSKKQIQAELDAYDGAIAYVDHQLGRVWDQLRQRGVLDNTLVIVVGDHGEEFAEHALMGHANSLYLPALHVPLVMVQPDRVPSDSRVTAPVSLCDLPNTVMDVLGIDDHPFVGSSWSRHWTGNRVTTDPIYSNTIQLIRKADWYPASSADMQSVCLENYHFIRAGEASLTSESREELYDFVRDPLERENLIDTAVGKEVAANCRELMRRDGALT